MSVPRWTTDALEPFRAFGADSALYGACKRWREDHPEMEELRNRLTEDGEIYPGASFSVSA